jgi:subtilisin family serine protease
VDATPRVSRRPALLAVAAAALVTSLAPAAPAQAAPATGSVIVGVKAHNDVDGKRVAPRIEVVPKAEAKDLAPSDGVRYVEPNETFKVAATTTVPNDPLFAQQWPMSQADGIGAPGAWWTSKGAGAVIAVLDTGADLTHPDLAPNLWTNPGEIPGNGIDDDGDGYVDDVHGVNVLAHNGNPQDGHGHGTEMAGAAAGVGGNRIGVTGVAPEAKIMPVKVLGDDGSGNTDSVIAGVQYAVAHGADVINLSMNGPQDSQALDETLAAARAAGVTIVASAGNDGANRDTTPSYPASTPGVLAVAATATDGGLTPFSAYGKSVPLAAPGENVLSTARGGRYEASSGTSIASAQVSGAAALLAAARPQATPDQIRDALVSGAHRLSLDSGMVGSGGTLDAAGAVSRLIPGAGPRLSLASKRTIRSRTGRITLKWKARGAVGAVALYRVKVGGRAFAVRSSAQARMASQRRVLRLKSGRYRWSVAAYDASGRPLAKRTGKVRVSRHGAKHRRRHR